MFATVAASEVDVSKHADLANRIFRTVVVSGAMLGTVLTPALAEPPPAPTAPVAKDKLAVAKPDTWDSVNKELEATDKKFDAAVADLVKAYKAALAKQAGTGTAMALASTKVDELKTTRVDLEARLGKTTRAAFVNEKAAPDVEKAETAWTAAHAKLLDSIDAVLAAKEDPALKIALAGVETARKERTAAAAKVKAARTKANKRPRTPVEQRPTGRGFVLS
jgi:hypothetical protein